MYCVNASGADTCANGQAAFWYSQDCFVGCAACDHRSGRVQTDLRGLGFNATLDDARQRTVNRAARAGSAADIYQHNPWRAPGAAPVADARRLAGGTPWGADAPEEGKYVNTSFARHGDRGSVTLARLPDRAGAAPRWALGGEATVSWQIRNNHGGGYQYRLCPAAEPLSEACFQRTPLAFERHRQRLALADGSFVAINGTFVDEGTTPAGSTWAALPLPATWLGPRCRGEGCEPWEDAIVDGACEPCPETPGSDCSRCDNDGRPSFPPFCEAGGSSTCAGGYEGEAAVVDVLRVPADLPPGDYVLGWRYDCEATAQVWSNCADVTLVEP